VILNKIIIKGRGAVGGIAKGEALVCKESIQGWAGIDDATGVIIEKGHSQEGKNIEGKILILPCSKGSNGWSCHFNSAMVNGHKPAGWIFSKIDSRCAVASVVLNVPMVTDFGPDVDLFELIEDGDIIEVNGTTGEIAITKENF
jgi:predicted aconitase with swiveling domain